MSIPHAQPGDVLDVRPLGEKLHESQTCTLIKTRNLEVIRLILPAGKRIPEHRAPGEITVQCVEGQVDLTACGKTENLAAGRMLYLAASEPHAVEAKQDSSVLVTILLGRPGTAEK